MARPSPYSVEQKGLILEAVKSGRKEGKKWPEVLKDAEGAGYKGGLQYLMKLARSAGAVRGRSKQKTTKGGRGAGRPEGNSKAKAATGTGLNAIDSIVEKMVEERVSKTLGNAVEALEAAIAKLKQI